MGSDWFINFITYVSYFFTYLIPYMMLGMFIVKFVEDSTFESKDYYTFIFFYPVLLITMLYDFFKDR